MKINLVANTDVGQSGYGIRVEPIVLECLKRGYEVHVFCRSYPNPPNNEKLTVTQLPFYYKYLIYAIAGFNIFVSERSKLVNKLSSRTKAMFEQKVRENMISGDLLHSWDDVPSVFQKAKELNMVSFKENPMGNSYGQAKMFSELGLSGYMSEEEEKCLALADYSLAPSEACFKSLEIYGLARDKIILCPFFVDSNKFYQKKAEKIISKKAIFTIIFVGLIRERKGVDTLLEAIHQLQKEGKKIKLILCGRRHYSTRGLLKKYERLLENLEIVSQKPHHKLVDVYNKGDIFVFPSICEGSAKVTYEAMACGLPIITTYLAGSVVRNGKDGFIIPHKNIEALKEKIIYFYDQPLEVTQMGRNAISRAQEYSTEAYGKRIIQAYEKALSKRKLSIKR